MNSTGFRPSDRQWAQTEEAEAERVKAVLLELQTAAFGLSQTYTTIVIFGGYAAFFAIWGFTKDHLSKEQAYWAALLIGVSVLTFVLFEIFKMVVASFEFWKVRSLLVRELPPAEFLAERKRIASSSNLWVQRVVLPIWIAAFAISLASGIIACGVLLHAFASWLAA